MNNANSMTMALQNTESSDIGFDLTVLELTAEQMALVGGGDGLTTNL